MQDQKTTETPATSPIINPSASPIVDSPIIGGSPYVNADGTPIYEEVTCGCSASVPAGSRVFFMKLVGILAIVGGLLMFGILKLLD